MVRSSAIFLTAAIVICPTIGLGQSLPTSYSKHVEMVCDAGWKEFLRSSPRQTVDRVTAKTNKNDVCSCMSLYHEDNKLNSMFVSPSELYRAATKYSLDELDSQYKGSWEVWNGLVGGSFVICLNDPDAGKQEQQMRDRSKIEGERAIREQRERAERNRQEVLERCQALKRDQDQAANTAPASRPGGGSLAGIINKSRQQNSDWKQRCAEIGVTLRW